MVQEIRQPIPTRSFCRSCGTVHELSLLCRNIHGRPSFAQQIQMYMESLEEKLASLDLKPGCEKRLRYMLSTVRKKMRIPQEKIFTTGVRRPDLPIPKEELAEAKTILARIQDIAREHLPPTEGKNLLPLCQLQEALSHC